MLSTHYREYAMPKKPSTLAEIRELFTWENRWLLIPLSVVLVSFYFFEMLRAHLRSQGVEWLEKIVDFVMRN